MSMEQDHQTPGGYALTVESREQRWTWALNGGGARVAARGEAPDRETARRSGMFAATAIEALENVGRRRF